MAFVPDDVTAFRFEAARFDAVTGIAEFDYALVGPAEPADRAVRETFTERVTLSLPGAPVDAETRRRLGGVVAVLGAVLGLSYYKAAAPPRFEIGVPGITDAAVSYLRLVIRHGLAEFAYRAGLPGLLDPEIVVEHPARPWPDAIVPEGDPLVPIGGGKDSVVTVESLVAVGVEPIQFAVNANSIIRRVADAAGRGLVVAHRELDPRLLQLNEQGARNGHVPVTAMNSLIALAQAQFLGIGPVVMSNESSASDPTLHWNGVPVNHQWSKSLDAERALLEMLPAQAGLQGACFSLLRPFSELRIARAFARTSAYDRAIVSCNRAFRTRDASPAWCGECDKCRFVFLAFAPHMDAERLVGMIGSDLFADPRQIPGFRALVGLGEHKPFECVGEEAESSVALSLVGRMPRWAGSPVVTSLLEEAPAFRVGDPALERRVMGESAADPLPARYEEARRALL